MADDFFNPQPKQRLNGPKTARGSAPAAQRTGTGVASEPFARTDQKINVSGPSLDDKTGPGINLYNEAYNDTFAPSAYQPREDENIQKTLDKQVDVAKSYRDNLGKTAAAMGNQAEANSRQRLAQSLRDVDKDFNRRGLLRSGMRVGSQLGARSNTANEIASNKAQINQGLLTNAQGLDDAAYGAAADKAGLGYNAGDILIQGAQTKIDRENAEAANNQMVWNSVLGAAGKVGGAYSGGMARPTTNNAAGGGGGGGGAGQYVTNALY